jgi:GT2 family glycosyltransferase
MNDLAIIVVSMNDAAWLGPCLRSVRRHAGGIRYEVVVVENGEIAETEAVIDSEFPDVRLIESENRGFAHGNNVALRTCEARYVLFLNPDTELVSGELSDLVGTLDERPEIGLVGVRHLTDGRLYPSIRNFPSASRALGAALGAERWPVRPSWSCERVLDEAAYERETDCDWTVGAFLLTRRAALEGAGVMDERFFLYSEETDLCLRIKQAGWSVRHLPKMTIIHHAGKGGLSPKMEAQNSYARMQHARKHFSGPRRELYRFALITGYGLRWLVALARRDSRGRTVAAASLAAASGVGEPPFVTPPRAAVSLTGRIRTDEPIELETAV